MASPYFLYLSNGLPSAWFEPYVGKDQLKNPKTRVLELLRKLPKHPII
jgi:hypothetical protein